MAYGAESKAAAIERMRECKHHSGSPNYSVVSRELGITRITLRRWWEAAEADPVTPILEKAKRPEKLTRGGDYGFLMETWSEELWPWIDGPPTTHLGHLEAEWVEQRKAPQA